MDTITVVAVAPSSQSRMIGYRVLLKKVGFALVSTWVVMTVAFFVVSLTPDPTAGALTFGASPEEAERILQEHRELRNLGQPIYLRYVDFMVGIVTLDWGRSYWVGRPVTAMILEHLPVTLKYVVPGVLLSSLGGVALGGYLGIRGDEGRDAVDALGRGSAYGMLGAPNFMLAQLFVAFFGVFAGLQVKVIEIKFRRALGWGGPQILWVDGVPDLLLTVVFPAVVVGTSLFASQLRYVRSESIEYASTDFVKLLKAQGANRLKVFRHVLRNALLPVLTLFVSDALAVLVIDVFVIEAAYRINGFGELSYKAFTGRDLPVILGVTLVVVFVGITGNLLTDLGLTVLDPRIEDD